LPEFKKGDKVTHNETNHRLVIISDGYWDPVPPAGYVYTVENVDDPPSRKKKTVNVFAVERLLKKREEANIGVVRLRSGAKIQHGQ
jgi:hypothetical protein